MQKTSEQQHSSNFGGIFSPLAQYPGANYARMWSQKKYDEPVAPKKTTKNAKNAKSENIFVRTKAVNMPLHNFKSALLLLEDASASSLDRYALRDAGIKHVRTLNLGLQAATLLAEELTKAQMPSIPNLNEEAEITLKNADVPAVDIIFCHARCQDISARAFIDMVRTHPAFSNIPIILLAKNDSEMELLQAVENTPQAKFIGLIKRPYTAQSLQEYIDAMFAKLQLEKTSEPMGNAEDFFALLQRYEHAKSGEGRAEFLFKEGMRSLQEKSYHAAISSFKKVLFHANFKGEAEVGLAAAYKAKGDTKNYRYFIYEATFTFIRACKWDKARMAFEKLMKIMPAAEDIYAQRAKHLVNAGNYVKAAETLLAAPNLQELVQHENTKVLLIEACLYTENPPFTVEQIVKTFTDASLRPLALSLRKALEVGQKKYDSKLQKRRDARKIQEEKVKKMAQNTTEKPHIHAFSESIPGAPSLLSNVESKKISSQDKSTSKQHGPITPLQEEDVESQALAAFPKLQEVASVIKVTLKLMKD